MKEKFIVQVAPLIPLPVLRTQVFSYWHGEALPAGTLVSIPFYFREITGVVINSHQRFLPENSLRLKNIRAVLEKKYLNENQMELARKIAEYYFAPLGSVLKLMVPKSAKQRAAVKETGKSVKKSGKISWETLKILNSNKEKFLMIGSGIKREKINADLIRDCLKKNKQCLILVPEIFFSHSVYEKLRENFSEDIVLVHSRITKGQFFDGWKKIRNGKTKIVVASKLGIFLPFSDLGVIIVQEEQDDSFKQWESMPRYNAARGAEFLAEISKAKLVLECSVPSAESAYRSENGEMETIITSKDKNISRYDANQLLQANDFPKLEVVALEGEKMNPDFPISKVLRERLAEVASKRKQAVIFVNRRGFSTRSICENCKKTLKCPKCERALIYSDEHGRYDCLHCSYKMELLSACPSCGGYQFSHRGIGTQTVEKKIKKLFPSAQVARIDADILRSSKKYKNIIQNFSSGKIDILVGTQSAIKGIHSENIALASSISGRDFADTAEYNSRALALSRIFHMANLLAKNGILIVQSFFGGNPLFDYLEKGELKKYYLQELAIRKRILYPPFRKFVKLVCRQKSEKMAEIESKKTFDLLRATGNNTIEIIGPFKPVSGQIRGLYQRNILIKCDPEKNIRDLPIRSVIGGLRKGWSVDVDPVSIL